MISMRSSTSRRTVPTRRSASAFARSARTGVVSTSIASAAKTASNAAVNFVSPSRIRNAGPDVRAWGAPPSLTPDLDGLQVGMVHDAGPRAGRLRRLRLRFPTAGLVVFGHSHIPLDLKDKQLGLRIFNPGSPTDRRRQRQGTMGLLRVGRGRLTAARIVPVTSPRDGAERSGVAHLRAPLRHFTDRISIGETLS